MTMSNINSPVRGAEQTVSNASTGNTTEFGRWQDVQRVFGIRRSYLYTLLAEGVIKSVVLRRPGNIRGCRLFVMESIRRHLNTLIESQSAQEVASLD